MTKLIIAFGNLSQERKNRSNLKSFENIWIFCGCMETVISQNCTHNKVLCNVKLVISIFTSKFVFFSLRSIIYVKVMQKGNFAKCLRG